MELCNAHERLKTLWKKMWRMKEQTEEKNMINKAENLNFMSIEKGSLFYWNKFVEELFSKKKSDEKK